jgi:hypothetical protein
VKCVDAAIARQRLGKHALAATDMQATIEELLEAVLSMRSVPRLHSDDERENSSIPVRGRYLYCIYATET